VDESLQALGRLARAHFAQEIARAVCAIHRACGQAWWQVCAQARQREQRRGLRPLCAIPDRCGGARCCARLWMKRVAVYPQRLWKLPGTSLWMNCCRPCASWLPPGLRKKSPAGCALSTGAVDKRGDKSVHRRRSASNGAGSARFAQILLSVAGSGVYLYL